MQGTPVDTVYNKLLSCDFYETEHIDFVYHF